MFDDLTHVLARVAGGALAAIIPAFLSRGVVNRICEFRPPFINTYLAFAIGFLAAIAWQRIVLSIRDFLSPDGSGQALALGSLFTWSGGLALIILSVSHFVRDRQGHSIGVGSGVVVTLLTCLLSAPIALVVWLTVMFAFMPGLHRQ